MVSVEEIVDIVKGVRKKKTNCFMGLGIIVYESIFEIPIIPLGSKANAYPRLPIYGAQEIIEVLAKIGELESPWHDGFHLINAQSLALTHISQFFSPPLNFHKNFKFDLDHMGARQMAALLGSNLTCINFIVLLGQKGNISVFKNGEMLEIGGDLSE